MPNTKESMTVTPDSTKTMHTNCNDFTTIIPTDITRIRSFVKSTQGEPNPDRNNEQSTEENLTRGNATNTKDTMPHQESDETRNSETASLLTPRVTGRVTRQSIRLAQQQNSSSNGNKSDTHSLEKATSQTPVKKTNKKKTRATETSKATAKKTESNNSVTVVPTSTISYKGNLTNSVATHEKVSTPDNDETGTTIDENTTTREQFDDTSNVVADDKSQIDVEMTSNKHQYELKQASMRTNFVCTLLDKEQNREQIAYWLRECFDE